MMPMSTGTLLREQARCVVAFDAGVDRDDEDIVLQNDLRVS